MLLPKTRHIMTYTGDERQAITDVDFIKQSFGAMLPPFEGGCAPSQISADPMQGRCQPTSAAMRALLAGIAMVGVALTPELTPEPAEEPIPTPTPEQVPEPIKRRPIPFAGVGRLSSAARVEGRCAGQFIRCISKK